MTSVFDFSIIPSTVIDILQTTNLVSPPCVPELGFNDVTIRQLIHNIIVNQVELFHLPHHRNNGISTHSGEEDFDHNMYTGFELSLILNNF